MKLLSIAFAIGTTCYSVATATSAPLEGKPPREEALTWTTPRFGSSASMPLGNGDVGANVWIESDGSIGFFLSKTDSWDGLGRLAKVGRFRVHIDGFDATQGAFEQSLDVETATLTIRSGEKADAIEIRCWIDANSPRLQLAIQSETKRDIKVTTDSWRLRPRELKGFEIGSTFGMGGRDVPVIVEPDTILTAEKNALLVCHENKKSIWAEVLDAQDMGFWKEKQTDPLLGRIFGYAVGGKNLVSKTDTMAVSLEPAKRHEVQVAILTTLGKSVPEWREKVLAILNTPGSMDYEAHCKWWSEAWDRGGRISISGDAKDFKAQAVDQGHRLQRYITLCAGRGDQPIKFNGSIFTVEGRERATPGTDWPKDEFFDADYRRWGGPYWFQNTRLIYWAMIFSGDVEMTDPFFKMYLDTLPFAKAQTQTWFGHPGGAFLETMYFWGASTIHYGYGWNREGKKVGEFENPFIRYYRSGSIELLAMGLERLRIAPSDKFLQETLLPLADEILLFFSTHFPRDGEGKILFAPASSLETWHHAVNPLPEIAGLRWVLDRLLGLGVSKIGLERQNAWRKMFDELPPIPDRTEKVDAPIRYLIPAEEYTDRRNVENPELYGVFPYRHFVLGTEGLPVGQETFDRRLVKKAGGWFQDAIQAALVGRVQEAKEAVTTHFTATHAGSAFPAFWTPNYDWVPDQDNGSVGVIALRLMLLQWTEDTLIVAPAWPPEWDVNFESMAPNGTRVKGKIRAGKIEQLSISNIDKWTKVLHGLPFDEKADKPKKILSL